MISSTSKTITSRLIQKPIMPKFTIVAILRNEGWCQEGDANSLHAFDLLKLSTWKCWFACASSCDKWQPVYPVRRHSMISYCKALRGLILALLTWLTEEAAAWRFNFEMEGQKSKDGRREVQSQLGYHPHISPNIFPHVPSRIEKLIESFD